VTVTAGLFLSPPMKTDESIKIMEELRNAKESLLQIRHVKLYANLPVLLVAPCPHVIYSAHYKKLFALNLHHNQQLDKSV
jgi:hypothetical protein